MDPLVDGEASLLRPIVIKLKFLDGWTSLMNLVNLRVV